MSDYCECGLREEEKRWRWVYKLKSWVCFFCGKAEKNV